MLLLLYGWFITMANLIMQQLGHVKGKFKPVAKLNIMKLC